MESGELGKIYKDTEIIIKQGDPGNCMYVIQEGLVEVVYETDQGEVLLALCGKNEILGEMAIFGLDVRSATVRALGEARVLTIDKKNFMRRMYEDPSLAFHLVQTMSARLREQNTELASLQIMRDAKPVQRD